MKRRSKGVKRSRAAPPRKRNGDASLTPVVERNIAAVDQRSATAAGERTVQERIADGMTRFAGSVPFIGFHALWFAGWIGINEGLLGIPPFDPFPYGLLTTIVSLEAIFLSMFILASQNRQMRLADRLNALDLQFNLLAEHEITRILRAVDAIASHLKIPEGQRGEMKELEKDVEPSAVLEALEQREKSDI
jgi:uncharacterized membrane protein